MASEKIAKFIEEVKALSVMELAELVSAIEEEFGVSAAPVAVAGAGVAAPAGEEAEAAAQTEFDVILKGDGGNKMNVIKVVKDIAGVALMEAKKLVDSAPCTIKEKVSKEEADAIEAKLKEAGADVEIK